MQMVWYTFRERSERVFLMLSENYFSIGLDTSIESESMLFNAPQAMFICSRQSREISTYHHILLIGANLEVGAPGIIFTTIELVKIGFVIMLV